MTGMALYVKFMMTLAAGLFGLGMVMQIVIDELFVEWDAFAHFAEWAKAKWLGAGIKEHRRAEDVMMELEKAKTTEASVRMIDRRREQLRELASVESRLRGPQQQGPIVLTPILPPAASDTGPSAS